MPDRPVPTALAVHLAQSRDELLSSIDQPPLARIRRRAVRRRRRRAVGGAAGLLAVAVATILLLPPWTARTTSPADPVAGAPPGGPVYTAAGITLHGLTEVDLPRLPGAITAVEFTDPEHGYLLSQCAAANPCPATVARTIDGGATWRRADLPETTRGQTNLDLLAFPGGRLTVTDRKAGWTSTDGGGTWQQLPGSTLNRPANQGESADRDGATEQDGATGHELLRAGPEADGCDLRVEIWRSGQGRPAHTPSQPDLGVCWVAPVATADGAWWVGGLRNGTAGLAVTRDLGVSWQPVSLPGALPGVNSVKVAALGSHLYAAALGADRTLISLFHSADGGRNFTRARGPVGGLPAGLAGAMVPLLDGRLLVVGTDRRWYISADDGATFTHANGNLPAVGRLARTGAGYVAYDLFGAGWPAYSTDGATWHKLAIH